MRTIHHRTRFISPYLRAVLLSVLLSLLLVCCSEGSFSQLGRADPNAPPVASAVRWEIRQAFADVRVARSENETPLVGRDLLKRQEVPTTPECVRARLAPCYTPVQVQRAYGIDQLLAQGIDGSGQTVVIVVSFGSPTLAADVAAFSRVMGLPDGDVTELYPLGTDFKEISADDTAGWRGETTLDAEWVHAIAPRARIVVLASPVSETEGVDGLPEFLQIEQYALDNHLGNVISQSWGTSENLLEDDAGAQMRAQFDAFYQRATAAGITVLTASGDHGALGDNLDQSPASERAADWPSAVPWVTTVGGTALTVNDDGSYGSERVWQGSGASGSGVSRFYAQPPEQALLPSAIQNQAGGKRVEADVSALSTGLLVYYEAGSNGADAHPGITGGTSASTPIWAGLVALADQLAGRPLGNINPALYRLGSQGKCFHDITDGRNAFHGDGGDPAMPGYDLPTGWGTPDAACLVPALAAGT